MHCLAREKGISRGVLGQCQQTSKLTKLSKGKLPCALSSDVMTIVNTFRSSAGVSLSSRPR